MISARLVANTTGSIALLPASVSFAMLLRSADANTSAGAPSPIWVTSSDEAAKLKVTRAPGCSTTNASPISVNAAVNEVAANTVTSPDTDGPAAGTSVASEPESSEPHEAPRKPNRATAVTRRR